MTRDIHPSSTEYIGIPLKPSPCERGCLIIVVVILAVLFILWIINTNRELSIKERTDTAAFDMRSMATGIEAYKIEFGVYPPSIFNLTTPIPWVSELPKDPFSEGNFISYLTRHIKGPEGTRDVWLLWSIGPDQKEDIKVESAKDYFDNAPSPSLLHITYDPSNGSSSRGDIWRLND